MWNWFNHKLNNYTNHIIMHERSLKYAYVCMYVMTFLVTTWSWGGMVMDLANGRGGKGYTITYYHDSMSSFNSMTHLKPWPPHKLAHAHPIP
jgi:hypothetical protein